MKTKVISVFALIGTIAIATPAQAQMFGGNHGRSVLGTAIGAGLGGVLGSNLAGTGVQQEGTAIGAVLGGLVGNGIAHSGSNRYGTSNRYGSNGYNVPSYGAQNYGYGAPQYGYAAQNYGYTQNRGHSVLGAGLGAIAGGVLGSNLAGTGVQQEGTAIGAALGGLVGYGIGNQSARRSGFSGGMSGQPYIGTNYGTFGGTYMSPPAMPAPQYIQGGYVNAGTYTTPSYTNYIYHPAPNPIIQTQKIVHEQPVIRKTIHVTQPQKIIRKTVHIVKEKPINLVEYRRAQPVRMEPPIMVSPQPKPEVKPIQKQKLTSYCYAGSSKRYDGKGHVISNSSCN